MMEKAYTIKSLVPHMTFNELVKSDNKGNVSWIIEKTEEWGFKWDWDGVFTESEIEEFEPELKRFVLSEFCKVEEL